MSLRGFDKMPPMSEDCYDQDNCFARFAVLEMQQRMMIKQNESIIDKLDRIAPAVKENSWWVEKIKWGFVFVTVSGVVLGIVSWIRR